MFFAKLRGRAKAPTNITSLPDNILCMIFHAVVFSPARRSLGYKTPLTYERCSSPFPVLQVSSRWRRLVSGMGDVWGSIFIQSPSRKHVERAAVWMRHAGERPLRITVVTSPTPSAEEQAFLHAIIEILARRLANWHEVVFEFNGRLPPAFAHHISALRGLPDPRLRNFVLHLPPPPPPHPREVLQVLAVWDAVHALPSLRAFRWDGAHTPGLGVSARLETLDLGSPIALDDLLARVPACRGLRSLRVRRITGAGDGFNPDAVARVEFPGLRELIIETHDTGAGLALLLERIAAPQLFMLGLKNILHTRALFRAVARLCAKPAADTITTTTTTTTTTGTPLYAVSLAFAQPPEEEDVLEWLWMPQLQGLVMLSLLGVRVTRGVLEALTVPAGVTAGVPCLPRMEGLHLGTVRGGGGADGDVDGEDTVAALLLRMLGSRFWAAPPACAMHEMDGVNVDAGRTRQLEKAAILVSEAAHTPLLKRYQAMFEQCVASTRGWEKRELEFEVV